MRKDLTVAGLSISEAKGQPHTVVDTMAVTTNGIERDRHGGPGLRQVSMMHEDIVTSRFPGSDGDLAGKGQENILLRGNALADLRLLDTLEIGDAILEVTQIGRRVNERGTQLCSADSKCLLSDYGVFGRVLHGGNIGQDTAIRHQQRLLRAHVITVSDRASKGTYEDKSGPAATNLLETWCAENHWGLWVESQVIPDEREAIATVLQNARQSEADIIITTGGTGIGPRDITPDVVAEHTTKLIPGIMDHIRLKYGEAMPLALTSRGVAGVLGNGLVYTLPGSTRAIPEYLQEIFKTMEHLLLLLKGLDAHG